MGWHSLRGRFRECPDPPYLLDKTGPVKQSEFPGLGFQMVQIELAGCGSDRDITRLIGAALGYPDAFVGGWDAFDDLLGDVVVEARRFVAVHVLDASEFLRNDVRLFARTVWLLMNTTESVGRLGGGSAQLEFILWGEWTRSFPDQDSPP